MRAFLTASREGDLEGAVIGGEAGFISRVGGAPVSAMAFTVRSGQVVAIHVIEDGDRLAALGA